MTVGRPSRVTVCLRGLENVATGPAAPCSFVVSPGTGLAPTPSVPLQVSSRMNVELVAADPAEVTITPVPPTGIKFIPNDGFAFWSWDVTPAVEASRQQLQIIVDLIYKDKAQDAIPGGTYFVDVRVESLWKTFRDQFWQNPLAAFKLVLPGGALWALGAALVGGVAALLARRRRKAMAPGPAGAGPRTPAKRRR